MLALLGLHDPQTTNERVSELEGNDGRLDSLLSSQVQYVWEVMLWPQPGMALRLEVLPIMLCSAQIWGSMLGNIYNRADGHYMVLEKRTMEHYKL